MSQATPNQHEIDTFCSELILNGGEQTKAWRATFPKSKAANNAATRNASLMMKRPEVKDRLAELQKRQAENDLSRFDVSAESIKETLVAVMKSGLSPLEGKPQLSAVVSAAAEINKMNGFHAPTKGELTGKDGEPLIPSEIVVRYE